MEELDEYIVKSRERRFKKKLIKRRQKIVFLSFVLITFSVIAVFSFLNQTKPTEPIATKGEAQKVASQNKEETAVSNDGGIEKKEPQEVENAIRSYSNFTYDPQKNKKIYTADGQKVAYLTFDDGPSSKTPKVLAILKEYNVKATFFIIGMQLEANVELIKSMYREGHIIANHGYSHNYKKIYASTTAFWDDLSKTANIVQNILGADYKMKIYRFPGGGHSDEKKPFKDLLEQNEYYYYDWNSLSNDSIGVKNPEKLFQNIVKYSKDKEKLVILMHDSNDKQPTVDALPRVIDWLKEQGYTFKTLADYDYN